MGFPNNTLIEMLLEDQILRIHSNNLLVAKCCGRELNINHFIKLKTILGLKSILYILYESWSTRPHSVANSAPSEAHSRIYYLCMHHKLILYYVFYEIN